MYAFAPTLDTVGTITRSVADTIILDRTLRPDQRPGAPDLPETIQIIVPEAGPAEELDATVARAFASACDRLGQTPFRVTEAAVAPLTAAQTAMDELGTIVAVEAYHKHGHLLTSPAGDQVDPRVIQRLRRAARISDQHYQQLLDVRRRLHAEVAQTPGHAFILCPTVKFVAPRRDELERDLERFAQVNEATMRTTRLFSFLDLPCIAIPCPRGHGELPASLMIAGAPGTDVAFSMWLCGQTA